MRSLPRTSSAERGGVSTSIRIFRPSRASMPARMASGVGDPPGNSSFPVVRLQLSPMCSPGLYEATTELLEQLECLAHRSLGLRRQLLEDPDLKLVLAPYDAHVGVPQREQPFFDDAVGRNRFRIRRGAGQVGPLGRKPL